MLKPKHWLANLLMRLRTLLSIDHWLKWFSYHTTKELLIFQISFVLNSLLFLHCRTRSTHSMQHLLIINLHLALISICRRYIWTNIVWVNFLYRRGKYFIFLNLQMIRQVNWISLILSTCLIQTFRSNFNSYRPLVRLIVTLIQISTQI